MSVLIAPGETVPVDGRVTQGESSVDTSAVTGESLPIELRAGDEVLAGSIVATTPILIVASRTAATSHLADILRLVEQAQLRKGQAGNLADKVAAFWTPAVHERGLSRIARAVRRHAPCGHTPRTTPFWGRTGSGSDEPAVISRASTDLVPGKLHERAAPEQAWATVRLPKQKCVAGVRDHRNPVVCARMRQTPCVVQTWEPSFGLDSAQAARSLHAALSEHGNTCAERQTRRTDPTPLRRSLDEAPGPRRRCARTCCLLVEGEREPGHHDSGNDPGSDDDRRGHRHGAAFLARLQRVGRRRATFPRCVTATATA